MHRRSFIRSIASLPVISSIPSVGKTEETDSFWSLYSTWMQDSDGYEGQIKIWADRELNREWTYYNYDDWLETVLLNVERMPRTDDMEFPVSLPFPGVRLSSVYIDPPYFSNLFYDQIREIPIVFNQGKYTEYQYEAHIDGDLIARNDSLIDLLQEVSGEL